MTGFVFATFALVPDGYFLWCDPKEAKGARGYPRFPNGQRAAGLLLCCNMGSLRVRLHVGANLTARPFPGWPYKVFYPLSRGLLNSKGIIAKNDDALLVKRRQAWYEPAEYILLRFPCTRGAALSAYKNLPAEQWNNP